MSAAILIGIVTRNRAGILPKALASALAQAVPNLQVAVIDDGSTDDTSKLRTQFPQVSWVRRETGQGYMSARNELMARPGYDFFVSLDDDAWFLRTDEIAVALQLLNAQPSVAAIAFDILSPDRAQEAERTAPQPTAVFIGCGHMLRLSAVREVGDYEATPGNYGGEEKDLCLRLMDAGHQVVRLPGVHVWHDKTMVARDFPQQLRSGVCNDLVIALRRTPLVLLPVALPAKFWRHLVFAWRIGMLTPCFAGFGLFLGSLPTAWWLRKPVRVQTLRAYMRLARM